MKKTGELLRKAREAQGLSFNEVALSLKISTKVLKAMENGDEKNLPAKTFLRGFVQSYANYLHLDTENILEVFYEEMGSTRPRPYLRSNDPTETSGADDESTSESRRDEEDNLAPLRQKRNTKTVVAVVLGFILVGLIIFTKKMIDKYSKEAEVPTAEVEQTMEGATPVSPLIDVESTTAEEANGVAEADAVASPSEEATAPATSTSPTSVEAPKPTPIASPSPTPQAVVTPTPSPSPSPSPSPTPTPSPTPKATPTPTPSPSPTATLTPSPSPTPKETPKPTESTGTPVELIVEALDNVEIEYSAPNGKTQKIRLSAEQFHTFKSKSGLVIRFSNGGAVSLILNGKEIGVPGDLGKPIKLSY